MDLQLDYREEPTGHTILVYKNLIDIMEIFQSCPAILCVDRNRSTNFVNSLERLPLLKMPENFTRVDNLLQLINTRIIEKFKGFRQGFRTFDKNFDGSLSFAEFVAGMNEMGVHLSVIDFRLVFEKIDFNNEGSIDYFKFCLLDCDQESTRETLKKQFVYNSLFSSKLGKVTLEKVIEE